jgi:hypothetical protein
MADDVKRSNPNWGSQVYAYALANYNKDGWDFVVETMSFAELNEETKNCRTFAGAIKKVRSLARLLDEQRLNAKDWY